jgi:hypothetical protein
MHDNQVYVTLLSVGITTNKNTIQQLLKIATAEADTGILLRYTIMSVYGIVISKYLQ